MSTDNTEDGSRAVESGFNEKGGGVEVMAALTKSQSRQRSQSWLCGNSKYMRDDVPAVMLAEHVTATLGCSYIALGLLLLSVSQAPQRRLAAFVISVWSSIQLLFLAPAFLDPKAAAQRFTFHTMVVCLTLASFAVSMLRRAPSESKE